MQKNKLNNVIVLKEVASNIVEEAIVFLKPNVNIEDVGLLNIKKEHKKESNKEKNIILEAENIIKNQIEFLQKNTEKEINKRLEKKYKNLKKIVLFLSILNLFCIFKIF